MDPNVVETFKWNAQNSSIEQSNHVILHIFVLMNCLILFNNILMNM